MKTMRDASYRLLAKVLARILRSLLQKTMTAISEAASLKKKEEKATAFGEETVLWVSKSKRAFIQNIKSPSLKLYSKHKPVMQPNS